MGALSRRISTRRHLQRTQGRITRRSRCCDCVTIALGLWRLGSMLRGWTRVERCTAQATHEPNVDGRSE